MKKFLKENWFKIITGIAMLIMSFGFFMNSITQLKAKDKNDLYITKGSFTPGETFTSGCGIYEGYVYLVDFEVNGENHYYKVPVHRFKTTNN